MSNDNIPEVWRILLPDILNPFYNIKFEEKLFRDVEAGVSLNTLRFWKNRRSAIIGISQKPEDELDISVCSKYNISIVKRFTGGGTVYHDLGNINWTIAIRKDSSIINDGIKIHDLYERFSYPVVKSLQGLGLNAWYKPSTSIYINGKKISGLAMGITRDSVLCHGTLLVDSNIKLLTCALKKLKEPVANINDYTTSRLSHQKIIEEIIINFKKIYNIKFTNRA